MRAILVAVLVLGVASVASADAIMPYEGECPPGLEKQIVSHSEACVPIDCTSGTSCPSGSSCQTLCVCRADREFTSDGRVIYSEPQHRVVEVGFCDDSGACAEGEVAERRECEPDGATDSFDPAEHRWTRAPYHGGCGGCASAGASGGAPRGLFFTLALLALLARARGRR